MTVFANRGLGLLYNYITQHQQNIETWFVPSNICFSVPFLFKKLQVHVVFYDFGSDTEVVKKVLDKKGKSNGILLFDYLGKQWAEKDIQEIKGFFDCVILDSCLSKPLFQNTPYANCDMQLYSTGDRKYTDLGYGAFATFNKELQITFNNTNETEAAIETRYEHLDSLWKTNDGKTLHNTTEVLIDTNWIDTGNNKISKDYKIKVVEQTEKVASHKKIINGIYKSILPSPLQPNDGWTNWRYNIAVENRDWLLQHIFDNGSFASSHYKSMAQAFGVNLPNAENIENHIVNLFNDFYITENKAEHCAMLIKQAYERSKIKPVNKKIQTL